MRNGSVKRGGAVTAIVACSAALVLLAAIYVGAYLALLEPWTFYTPAGSERIAGFRFGGEAAKVIFWPLTQLDMLLRPEYWRA